MDDEKKQEGKDHPKQGYVVSRLKVVLLREPKESGQGQRVNNFQLLEVMMDVCVPSYLNTFVEVPIRLNWQSAL